MQKIRDIKKNRLDLTDFLIHFTKINGNLSAFETLLSIIKDGFIKSNWSIRNGKRTVFGKHPAICFTETPLYGFKNYVDARKNKYAIDSYGIALLQSELFKYGARNVFYGTTLYKEEKHGESGNYYLDGFPEEELYRYMLTDINEKNDWTHEREWRWTNQRGLSDIGGLPIWSSDNYKFRFNLTMIILKSNEERDIVMNLFKSILDFMKIDNTPPRPYSFQYSNIDSTGIIVLDEIDKKQNPHFKIEQLIKDRQVFWIGDHIEGMRPK